MESLKKNIEINKKILLIMVLIIAINGFIYTSYSLFKGSTKPKHVVTLKTGTELPLLEQLNKSIEKAKMHPVKLIIEEDGIKYFSGTNEQINFNYVWYSGKLWRITSVYPDGKIKMITEDSIATIGFGSNATFENSWAYQWLNQEFLGTLENYSKVIDTEAIWDNTLDATATPVKPLGTTTVIAPVGLLTAYEYYKAYQNITPATNYLVNVGWWTLTPATNSSVRNPFSTHTTSSSGPGVLSSNNASDPKPIRPAIILKANLHIIHGDGTKENPYILKEAESKTIVNKTTKLNERLSGEYVNFNNQVWRIVDIEYNTENGKENKDIPKVTKLILNDYLKNDTGGILTKRVSNNTKYGTGTTTDTYWDYYLNNTWLNSINESNPSARKMLIKSTYYLGIGYNKNYKATICETVDDDVSFKDCKKLSASSAWTGYVGLSRIGEMFGAQLIFSGRNLYWSITPYNSKNLFVYATGGEMKNDVSTTAYAARPTITLKSDVVITGGLGMENSPFEIFCESCTD